MAFPLLLFDQIATGGYPSWLYQCSLVSKMWFSVYNFELNSVATSFKSAKYWKCLLLPFCWTFVFEAKLSALMTTNQRRKTISLYVIARMLCQLTFGNLLSKELLVLILQLLNIGDVLSNWLTVLQNHSSCRVYWYYINNVSVVIVVSLKVISSVSTTTLSPTLHTHTHTSGGQAPILPPLVGPKESRWHAGHWHPAIIGHPRTKIPWIKRPYNPTWMTPTFWL